MHYQIVNINQISKQEYRRFFSMMSAEKQKRVNQFRFEKDKKRSVAGEILARRMIAACCPVREEEIIFTENAGGKPFAKDLPIEYNISHSGELVVCAVSDSPIGVDIEKMRNIPDTVIRRVCTQREQAYVSEQALDAVQAQKRFFEIWTFKEAYFKCMGTGITDFHSICFFDCPDTLTHESRFLDDYALCIVQTK